MTRSETLQALFAQFDQSARQVCDETGGMYCEIDSRYSGEELPENLCYRTAKIYYHLLIVEFRYTAHGVLNVINSLLDCLVYLDKGADAIGIPLSFLVDYVDFDTVTPLCIPLISNPLGMQQAFACLQSVLQEMLTRAETLCSDGKTAEDRFVAELCAVIGIKKSNAFLEDEDGNLVFWEGNYDFLTLRYSSAAFLNHIKGNREQAIKQLRKTKVLTGYEQRMLRLWEAGETTDPAQLSAVVKNAQHYNNSGVQKNDRREFWALFVSWFVLAVGTSALYAGVFALLVFLQGRHAVYLMGPSYNFPSCILFGFITAIALSYFTRFQFYKWLFKKQDDTLLEMDHIQNGGGADRLMKGFLAVIVSVCLIGCLLLSRWGIVFQKDGLIDQTAFFSLKGEYYAYEDVDRVYYKADRVNGFGDTLPCPSYVLVLRNGREIDFYDFDDVSVYSTQLIGYLREQGVTIVDG